MGEVALFGSVNNRAMLSRMRTVVIYWQQMTHDTLPSQASDQQLWQFKINLSEQNDFSTDRKYRNNG